MKEFQGRTMVVTGGAGDIGRACARCFAQAGAHVHLVDVDADRLAEAAADVGRLAGTVTAAVSDLAGYHACANAIAACGRAPFALVHMAGLFEHDPLAAGDHGTWQRALASNLTSAYDVALAFRDLRDRGVTGRVVFSSSRAFQRGTPGRAAYAAAKGGVVGLVRAFSRDFAPDIRVNAVSPGLIATRMTRELIAASGAQRLAEIPLARYGTPDDVAGVVAFLCSELAAYVTGQVITVDGGVING